MPLRRTLVLLSVVRLVYGRSGGCIVRDPAAAGELPAAGLGRVVAAGTRVIVQRGRGNPAVCRVRGNADVGAMGRQRRPALLRGDHAGGISGARVLAFANRGLRMALSRSE